MKLPPTFSTGDPSYFVVASTSGSASPTVLTVSKVSAGVCFVGLRFIEAQYSLSRDAIQANLRNCNETGAPLSSRKRRRRHATAAHLLEVHVARAHELTAAVFEQEPAPTSCSSLDPSAQLKGSAFVCAHGCDQIS